MEIGMKDAGRTFGGAWLYALAGIAAGAALGVLLAPAAGKETRSKVKDWLDQKRAQGRAALIQRKQAAGAQKQRLTEAHV